MLTGHRGLPEAVLFTDLDKLEEGDCFYLHILDETLAYQVDRNQSGGTRSTPRIWKSPRGRITAPLLPARRMPSTPTACLCAAPASPYNGEEETNTPQAVQYQALRTGTVVKRVVDAWPWIAVTGSIVIGGEALLLHFAAAPLRKKREEDD